MTLLRILLIIVIFSIIVIFHELGHFWLAKANKIQVNEFSLGLGPTIWGFKKGETKYSLKLLPFGGACMMEGEDDESENPRAFPNKSVWARISVVFAGPFFNFIMAFICAYILICASGYAKPVVTNVIDGYPAQAAGISAGDTIVKMDHFRVRTTDDVALYSALHSGEEVEVTYRHNGETKVGIITPAFNEEENRYLYGFAWSGEKVKGNFFSNLGMACNEVRYWVYYVFGSLKMLVTGGVSVNELSGPVGIVSTMSQTTGQAVSEGGFFYGFLTIILWVTMLSANLGVMNLLPLPALDGGRLLFLIIEAIRRKKIDPKKEGFVHMIGIVLLLALMVIIMFNDIRKLFI